MPFSFLSPWFLAGLVAMAVPLLLHFFSRRTVRTRTFSTLRFFTQTQLKTLRAHRFRIHFLVVVRMLLICCIIFLFARPYIPPEKSSHSSIFDPATTIYCWIDPTISMSTRTPNGSLTQHAMAYIDTLAHMTGPHSQLHLFSHKNAAFVPFTNAKDLPRPPRHAPSNLGACIDAYSLLPRTKNQHRALFLFSDFHQGFVDDLSDIGADLDEKGISGEIWCVNLAPDSSDPLDNFSIGHIRTVPGSPMRICATLWRSLTDDSTTVAVSLQMDGTEFGTHHARFAPGVDSTQLSIILRADNPADNRKKMGVLQLERHDDLTHDNTGYFVMPRRQQKRICIIGNPKKTYPLRAALQALYPGSSRRTITHVSPGQLHAEDIDSADILFLYGLDKLPPRFWQIPFETHKKICLYSPALDNARAGTNVGLFRRFGVESHIMSVSTTIDIPHAHTSLWKDFSPTAPSDVHIERALSSLPGNALIRTRDGGVFFSVYEGRYIWGFFSASMGLTNTNNLYQRGIYLPLLDRCISTLMTRIAGSSPNWTAGQSRRNPFFGSTRSAAVFDSAGQLVATWNTQTHVELSSPGHYNVVPDSGKAYYLGATPNLRESPRIYLPGDKLPLCSNTHSIENPDSFFSNVHQPVSMKALPRILTAALFLLLLAEVLLSHSVRLRSQSRRR